MIGHKQGRHAVGGAKLIGVGQSHFGVVDRNLLIVLGAKGSRHLSCGQGECQTGCPLDVFLCRHERHCPRRGNDNEKYDCQCRYRAPQHRLGREQSLIGRLSQYSGRSCKTLTLHFGSTEFCRKIPGRRAPRVSNPHDGPLVFSCR
jgi:hypothetical protein